MALLWADGFDHYGSDEGNMLDGIYALASDGALSTSIVNTGTHSWNSTAATELGAGAVGGLRKVLPASNAKMGAAFRLYMPTLPGSNVNMAIAFMTSTATLSQVTCFFDSNGAIRFYRGINQSGTGSVVQGGLIATTDPILTAAAWQHIEIQICIHDTLGWIRVAVNGVHRYQGTGLDTKQDTSNIVSVLFHQASDVIGSGGNADTSNYIDDLYMYDFVGDSAVDTDFVPATDGSGIATNYIGELQCMYLPPNADTAEADWTPSTGVSGEAMIDETTPNDADYISSSTAGDLSEFDLTDLPPEITYVRGLMLIGRLDKTDSGVAMTKFGMKSDVSTTDATERAITTAPTYWWNFINVDPDSGVRWTRASLNAAWIRLIRSV